MRIALSSSLNLNLATQFVLVVGTVLPRGDASRLLVMFLLIIEVNGILTHLSATFGGPYLLAIKSRDVDSGPW